MNKTSHRLYSIACAVLVTVAMLGAIDHLAGNAAPTAEVLATVSAPRA